MTYHARDFAVVGFVEVVRHIPRLKTAMDRLVRLAAERATPLAILIDYPGFNIALAKRLKGMGVRVLYYVSPQVWAWGEGRVRTIARHVDRMAVVFAFEKEFYRERGVDVEFVGTPASRGAAPRRGGPSPEDRGGAPPLLGLLPGSRRQEVARHLPVMLGAARILGREVPGLTVALGLAPGIDGEVDRAGGGRLGAPRGGGPAGPHVRPHAPSSALLVSSGTATLEAACAGAPMVVVYRMAPASYAIARSLVKTRHIGLVNLVAGEEVVPELIQNDASPGRLAAAVRPFLTDAASAERVSRRLLGVRARLGTPGASDRVARMALGMLEDS